MIRIAVIGAPETGKSALAKKIATNLRDQGKSVLIVDGYMKELINQTGYAFDVFGTYPQNFQVLFHRWTKEQEAEQKGCDILIAVGSLYESILYTALRINSDIVLKKGIEIQLQGSVVMQCLGVIQSLIATQDLLFFVPYTDKMIEKKGRSYDVVVNEKLPSVVEGYFRPLNVIDGTTKVKVGNAIKAIQEVEQWQQSQASTDEQQSV